MNGNGFKANEGTSSLASDVRRTSDLSSGILAQARGDGDGGGRCDLPRTVVSDAKASHPLAKKSVQPSHAITKSFPADLFEGVNCPAEFVGAVIGLSVGLVLGASYVLTVFTLKGIYSLAAMGCRKINQKYIKPKFGSHSKDVHPVTRQLNHSARKMKLIRPPKKQVLRIQRSEPYSQSTPSPSSASGHPSPDVAQREAKLLSLSFDRLVDKGEGGELIAGAKSVVRQATLTLTEVCSRKALPCKG